VKYALLALLDLRLSKPVCALECAPTDVGKSIFIKWIIARVMANCILEWKGATFVAGLACCTGDHRGIPVASKEFGASKT
jgi:hypothetical protein